MMLKLIEEYESHVMEESANISAEELNRVQYTYIFPRYLRIVIKVFQTAHANNEQSKVPKATSGTKKASP